MNKVYLVKSMSGLKNTPASSPRVLDNQSGVASFLVTMVLMVVITLIVLGFAQISQRNQREALDNQLNTQAFYAAETGVNLVRSLLQTATGTLPSKTSCPGDPNYKQLVNADTKVSNSCLTIDPAPTDLRYDNVGITSTVVPLKPDTTPFYGNGTLTIVWRSKTNVAGSTLSNCYTAGSGRYTQFPPTTGTNSWSVGSNVCPYGLLRFDMVDFTQAAAAAGASSNSLAAHSMTVFAPPTASGASQNAIVKLQQSATQPTIAPATVDSSHPKVTCSDTDQNCSIKLVGVNFNDTNYLRLTSIYKDVNISSISGVTNTGIPVRFIGAQVVVDSTGKAVDVLRRMQVRLDQNNQLTPSYALQGTTGVCKLSTTTGGTDFNDSCSY